MATGASSKAKRKPAAKRQPSIWFRVLLPDGALGPGKIELMRLVADTGSVSAAARRLKMSHVRSLKLVAELNALFEKPLIETRAGGEAGGGAALTPLGRRVLDLYARLEADVQAAAEPHLSRLVEAGSDG